MVAVILRAAVAPGLSKHLTEMHIRDVSWGEGVEAASA